MDDGFQTCKVCGKRLHPACGVVLAGEFVCAWHAIMLRRQQAEREAQRIAVDRCRNAGILAQGR